MGFPVFGVHIMAVIGSDQRNFALPSHIDQFGQNFLLLGQSMILNFQIEILFAKEVLVLSNGRNSSIPIVPQEPIGDLALQTSAHRNHTFMVLFEEFHIEAWFVVKAFCVPQ